MNAPERVDFFVAGMQKGGTTALDALLREHPGVSMARTKEPHFFDDDTLDWETPEYERYHAHFDGLGTGRIVGEATPILTYWPRALERIRAYNPAARLVIGLRHPAFRAFSHWRMERYRGEESLDFHLAILNSRTSAVAQEVHRVFSYVERGFYADQIENAQRLFAREQIHVLRTDHLWLEPATTMHRLCAFLGITPMSDLPQRARYRVSVDAREVGVISPKDRMRLDRTYAADIERTAELTGVDLTDWLEPAYREPMA